MAKRCYFTGRKARRACPGVEAGRSVPISAEACTSRMMFDIECPADCRHVRGNYEWIVDKTSHRMPARVKEEPWLRRLLDHPDKLDLFMEIERNFSIGLSRGDFENEDEAARVLSDLTQASRARSTGLILAGSNFELSRAGGLYHRLSELLDYFRGSYFDKGDDREPVSSFFHKLLQGRRVVSALARDAQAPRLQHLNQAALGELKTEAPTDEVVEQRIQETVASVQRTLDYRVRNGGYINFLRQFY